MRSGNARGERAGSGLPSRQPLPGLIPGVWILIPRAPGRRYEINDEQGTDHVKGDVEITHQGEATAPAVSGALRSPRARSMRVSNFNLSRNVRKPSGLASLSPSGGAQRSSLRRFSNNWRIFQFRTSSVGAPRPQAVRGWGSLRMRKTLATTREDASSIRTVRRPADSPRRGSPRASPACARAAPHLLPEHEHPERDRDEGQRRLDHRG